MKKKYLDAASRCMVFNPGHGDGLQAAFFKMVIARKALAEGTSVNTHSIRGFMTKPLDEIVKALHDTVAGLQVVRKDRGQINKSYAASRNIPGRSAPHGNEESYIFMWDDGVIQQTTHEGQHRFDIHTTNANQAQALIDILNPVMASTTGHAKISVIAVNAHGPSLMNVGEGGVPFNRDNYTPDIAAAFDHVVEDLASSKPCGRLIIMTGPPGCGKTYFIEGLIEAQIDCRYILLPPAVLSSITGPSLLQAILPESDDSTSRIPTVFIIEDADQCLVSRELDTLPAISTILNLADGILGRALDVRIVATSNAKKQDVDKALLRDGRLCRSIEFEALGYDQANRVYEREVESLTGSKPTIPLATRAPAVRKVGFSDAIETATYCLADVYRAAKNATLGKEDPC